MTIDVRDFIQNNYTEYLGDSSFLRGLSDRNFKLWSKCQKWLDKEREAGGVLDIETRTFSGINNFEPGYIDEEKELIVGLQTDTPLKRIVNPYGGMRMVESCLKAYGYELDEDMKNKFQEYRKTHNQGVFDAYTKDVRAARHTGLLTGLPDAYGRGRLIGDYRRVALYGIDALIAAKREDYSKEPDIQLREDISEQIRALQEIADLAKNYGRDISKPAQTTQEALQAIYFAYLAAVKQNNGAATSLGRVSTFIDIYIERDMKNGILDEAGAQELIDQFIMKLRFIRHLRTPEYDELFGGDPTWITEAIGGMGLDGRSLVTKTSYRFLQSLLNLGTAPEPNMTILWDENLPRPFKEYCSKISILTDAIQYESDSLMRPVYGDDYGISCCVSAMALGKDMQYFGARCNVAKALLYALNAGRDEKTGELVIPDIPPIETEPLDYKEVVYNYGKVLKWVIKTYVDANNTIHYMHDKYAYESSQMALHDTHVRRLMAFGLAGFSVAVDSLSAIKHARVTPIRNADGITTNFTIHGDYPKYGNDDSRADTIAITVAKRFNDELHQYQLHRGAEATLSILTITSNVMYGKKTGATPDGRLNGAPFAPGANPMHGRDNSGPLASLSSVAKIDYQDCRDGISNTFSMVPKTLGSDLETQIRNLVAILDGYFSLGGHHLNVNVLNKETLEDAIEHPEQYPNLTVRISGYAVLFNKLSNEQKREILMRTFHC